LQQNKNITPGVAGVVIGTGLNELIRKKVEKHDATLDPVGCRLRQRKFGGDSIAVELLR
jgi:hypothetical protein